MAACWCTCLAGAEASLLSGAGAKENGHAPVGDNNASVDRTNNGAATSGRFLHTSLWVGETLAMRCTAGEHAWHAHTSCCLSQMRCNLGAGAAAGLDGDGGFLDRLLPGLASPAELAAAARPRLPAQTIRVLAQFAHNDLLLASMGVSKEARPAPEFHVLCSVLLDILGRQRP